MIRMDINEPLDTLKSILEDNFPGISNHKFTIQDGPEVSSLHCGFRMRLFQARPIFTLIYQPLELLDLQSLLQVTVIHVFQAANVPSRYR